MTNSEALFTNLRTAEAALTNAIAQADEDTAARLRALSNEVYALGLSLG